MTKIALCMIVKGSREEATAFSRCVKNAMPYVDGAFVTITHERGKVRNRDVERVCLDYNGDSYETRNAIRKLKLSNQKISISDFEWTGDFAAARNFNFSQVPPEYTHILWCDADDVFRGLDRLRGIIQRDAQKDRPSDGFGMWYLYHFDEYRQADVVHKKTMVVRNPAPDGWVKWVGELHEELVPLVSSPEITMIDKYFNGGIDRMHMTDQERDAGKTARNLSISKAAIADNPSEPRNYLNYAQSLHGSGKYRESAKVYSQFLDRSGSDEEKFIALIRISEAFESLNDREGALRNAYIALGMRPQYPDAYFHIGMIMYKARRTDEAELYFLMGLKMRPKYNEIMVYNPRDYDYNPMRMLIRIYTDKGRPDLALPFMKSCLDIYPNNNRLKDEYDSIKSETERLTKVVSNFDAWKRMSDDDFKKSVEALPDDIRSHPGVCSLYNQRFAKMESSGKEVSIYCYPTAFDFNPELFERVGFGGSEEAVMNMSRELADLGWDVTVYNRCGPVPKRYGKVMFRPFWMWNPKDVCDVLIIWRSPKPLDFDLGAKKVILDLHDVVPREEFTSDRLEKVHRIMVKTQAHRSLFPNVPDDRISVVPNGQDNSLFTGNSVRDPYLLLNTSSPDRSMDVLPELFMEVRKTVPQARMKWCYGWGNFDDLFKGDPLRQKWKAEVERKMELAGIECLGKVSQKEVARLYEEATILAYPSEFFEIDCISVKKAQAAGCVPVTTDFGAFDESVQWGYKVHSKKTKANWSKPYQFGYGITDKEMKREWVQNCVNLLSQREDPRRIEAMKKWARKFDWDKIAAKWDIIMRQT